MRSELVTNQLMQLFFNIIEMEERIADNDQFEDLTNYDMRTLSAIGTTEPKSLKDVGEYLRVKKQTVHVATNSLIKRGYAYKKPNPNDGRSTWIILTEKGVDAVNYYRKMLRENVVGMTEEFDNDQIDTIIRNLVKMNSYMEERREETATSVGKKK